MTEVCAGIDIGGTNTVFGLVDRAGEVLAEEALPTGGERSFAAFVETICKRLRASIAVHEVALRAIGIGAPNANYLDGTIPHAPNLPWGGELPLGRLVGEHFPEVTVHVTNDANAAAQGELLYGGARGLRDFLMITLGTGLGGGLVVDGRLVHGHDGFAAELGHIVIDWQGRPCGCGRLGCLETYASATGLVTTARERLTESDYPSLLRDLPKLDAPAISAAARAGDALAGEVFESTGRWLGRALANTVAVTSPARIFLFGGLARAGNLLLEPTRRHFEQSLLEVYSGKVRLELSELMDRNAAVLGAAALAWDHSGAWAD